MPVELKKEGKTGKKKDGVSRYVLLLMGYYEEIYYIFLGMSNSEVTIFEKLKPDADFSLTLQLSRVTSKNVSVRSKDKIG